MMKNIKLDFVRSFTSLEFWISISGILLVALIGCFGSKFEGNTVIRLVWHGTFSIQFLLTMIFGVMPYAGAVCEDLEYGYIHQILIRCNLRKYCISRTITILLSSVSSFTVAMMFLVVILRFRFTWIDVSDSVYQSAVSNGSFRNLLIEEHFYLYMFLFSIQLGMLIGILALVSTCISLFITNKLLVLSIPVIAYYFISQYVSELFPENIYFNLDSIYGGKRNVFNNDFISFAYSVLVMIVLSGGLMCLFYFRLRRRLNGEC